MKAEFRINAGMGITETEIIEYEGDITDEELNSEWYAWSMNYIDGGWSRVDEDLE